MQLARTIFSNSATFIEKKKVENRLRPKSEFSWPKKIKSFRPRAWAGTEKKGSPPAGRRRRWLSGRRRLRPRVSRSCRVSAELLPTRVKYIIKILVLVLLINLLRYGKEIKITGDDFIDIFNEYCKPLNLTFSCDKYSYV